MCGGETDLKPEEAAGVIHPRCVQPVGVGAEGRAARGGAGVGVPRSKLLRSSPQRRAVGDRCVLCASSHGSCHLYRLSGPA